LHTRLTPSINSLSNEVLNQILLYLDFTSIKCLSLTNHRNNEATRSRLLVNVNLILPENWGYRPNNTGEDMNSVGDREIAKSIREILGWPRLQARFTGRFSMITGLTISPTINTTYNLVELFRYLARGLKSLKVIPSRRTDSYRFFYELSDLQPTLLSNLELLHLVNDDDDDHSFVHILTRLAPNIVELTVLYGIGMQRKDGFCCELQKLHDDDCECWDDKIVMDVTSDINDDEDDTLDRNWVNKLEQNCKPFQPVLQPKLFPDPTRLASLRRLNLSYDFEESLIIPEHLGVIFGNAPEMSALTLIHIGMSNVAQPELSELSAPRSLLEHRMLRNLRFTNASRGLFQELCLAYPHTSFVCLETLGNKTQHKYASRLPC